MDADDLGELKKELRDVPPMTTDPVDPPDVDSEGDEWSDDDSSDWLGDSSG